MSRGILLAIALLIALAPQAAGHAPPTPIPLPPLHVKANQLLDSANTAFLLRGVAMPGLETLDLTSLRAMTAFTFRVMQLRWNMNAVRFPLSPALWRRDGQPYLDRVAAIVALANSENLVAVLAPQEDAPLPTAATLDFWKACGTTFAKTPGVIFALFNEPAPRTHTAADWQLWRNGGATSVGMQTLVAAIRATGAQQIVSAPAFQDAQGFQGFGPDAYLTDPNVIYEWHPYFDVALSDTGRTAAFSFLSGTFPLYAGAWGMPFGHTTPTCTAIPRDVSKASDLLLQTMSFFDFRNISWTAADFAPGSLIQNFIGYTPTNLAPWTCDATSDPHVGIGQFVLLWMTGDPAGFGSLAISQIASIAGGIPAPIAPGEIISLYGQGIGSGSLADTRVLFDGRPASVLLASPYQVNVQVPYEVGGQKSTTVQLIYRTVPSNTVDLAVVDAAPGLLTFLGTTQAAVLNQDGSVNQQTNPAARGTIISFFAVGAGVMKSGVPALPVSLKIGSIPTELFYAGEAPGLIGCLQVNARIPATLPDGDRASVILAVGAAESRSGVTFWMK
ncbi:MAG: hypothetical protein JWP63_6022 [Candidatus Solibacter sp.]|nr:hypothetical protein [Candidatus Solibacter sp.]